jgi:hypothetical protein
VLVLPFSSPLSLDLGGGTVSHEPEGGNADLLWRLSAAARAARIDSVGSAKSPSEPRLWRARRPKAKILRAAPVLSSRIVGPDYRLNSSAHSSRLLPASQPLATTAVGRGRLHIIQPFEIENSGLVGRET